jgi:hypothetical protein
MLDSDRQILGDISREIRRLTGKGIAAERTSVAPQRPQDAMRLLWQRCISSLSSKGVPRLASALRLIDLGELERLDSKYAHETLEVLQEIITRIGPLDRLPTLSIPNRPVQLAFEEAHRCFLYGFSRVCVVLCRSMVEASLREGLRAMGTNLKEDIKLSVMLNLPTVGKLLGSLQACADRIRLPNGVETAS